MKYLLDVNVLVAWGWANHIAHERAMDWLECSSRRRGVRICTTPITEIGFVRVSIHQAARRMPLEEATGQLHELTRSLGAAHLFLADDQGVGEWPSWCVRAGQTTDAHLLELATRHQARLATLDTSIPGAFLLPG